MVGTCSLQVPNSIHILNFNEEANSLDVDQIVDFNEGEIWDIKSSPYNANVFACSYTDVAQGRAEIKIIELNEKEEGSSVVKSESVL